MEVASMSSLRSVIRPSLSESNPAWQNHVRFSTGDGMLKKRKKGLVVVARKGKKALPPQYRRPPPPSLPKVDPNGNPHFVIFVRDANLNFWFPLTFVEGGSTAKLMVAAKDTFLGKYLYKDTTARNLAAVIYKDEEEVKRLVKMKFRELSKTTDFRFGYKLIVMF